MNVMIIIIILDTRMFAHPECEKTNNKKENKIIAQ